MYETRPLQYYYNNIVSFPQSPSRVHIGTYINNPVSTRRENNISFSVCAIVIWVCENIRLFPGPETAGKLVAFTVHNIIYKYIIQHNIIVILLCRSF